MPVPAFNFQLATPAEIEAKALGLLGRPLDTLGTGHDLTRPSSAVTKGLVGMVIEAYFGITPNSLPQPDFVGAGIELKSVPIRIDRVEARAKERISLGMIDWSSLASETWLTAHARRKLQHLMLVFYEWSPLRPIGYFETLVAGLWTPDQETLAAIERDWRTIQRLEIGGRRGEVSESLTRLLGAATKGAGHGSISRAWSLKQPFVTWIYRSMAGQASVSKLAPRAADPEQLFERDVIALLRGAEGRSIAETARMAEGSVGGGKAAAARVIRSLVGQHARGRSGDFGRFGIELKVVPINGHGRPVEATSFPSFVHEELAYESWPESDLLGRLNRILFVPIERARNQDQATAIVRRAFFWSPPEDELEAIGIEWEEFRRLISAGLARQLPKASQTRYIHVRPKARDARDIDLAPGGFDVVRKSFWLNQDYVERIIREHGGLSR